MSKIRVSLSIAMLMAMLQVTPSNCWASWSFELGQAFTFSKNSATIENLDKGNYEETQVTTAWTKGRDVNYSLIPEVIWQNSDWNVYGLLSGTYGWTYSGKQIGDALEFNTDGTTKGFSLEAGYIMDIDKRFTILPHVGYNWALADIRLKHQRERRPNPICFISQNGNRISSLIYYPYIGVEFDWVTELCCSKTIQFALLYNFGFLGAGHLRNSVPYTFITDSGATSRFGSLVKYRDLINHTMEFEMVYEFAKQWRGALEFSYSMTYNTHKLPIRYKHNKEIVKQGQFTASQYHVMSQTTLQQIAVIFVLNYSLSGEGVFVR